MVAVPIIIVPFVTKEKLEMKIKALALLSGGLDSRLAVKLMLEQRIEVEAVSFVTVFCTCTSKKNSCLASQDAARKLGIKLKVFNISQEYLAVVKNPKYGYGSNMNPCIDCRILMFKKAKEYMEEIGAFFLFTGEVLGERPMSQRKEAMRIIERDAELCGLILRPLSALVLEPTVVEKKGWVDRNRLLGIAGRSRKPQIKLAQELGVKDYPCPAGGCLLTDPGFARRFKDLVTSGDISLNDIQLLKVGRHFRLSSQLKVVVGRDEQENRRLENLIQNDDILFRVECLPGPLTLARGMRNFGPSALLRVNAEDSRRIGFKGASCTRDCQDEDFITKVAAITARYSQGRDQKSLRVSFGRKNGIKRSIIVTPINNEELDRLRI